MPGRTFQVVTGSYRYSINGQEKTPEIAPNTTTALFWEYDSRIGRRWNLDPKPMIGISDYSVFMNNPIKYLDALGDSSNPGGLSILKLSKESYKNSSWTGFRNKAGIFTMNSVVSGWNQAVTSVEELPANIRTIGNVFTANGRAENRSKAFSGFISLINWWNREPWKDVNTYEDLAGSLLLGKALGASNPFARGNSYLNLLRKDRVPVKLANAEELVYLKRMGKQADYNPYGSQTGDILLSKNSRIQLIEEAIHYQQTKRFGIKFVEQNLNQLEFEAQIELLRIGKAEQWSNAAMQELRNAAHFWGKRAIADLEAKIAQLK